MERGVSLCQAPPRTLANVLLPHPWVPRRMSTVSTFVGEAITRATALTIQAAPMARYRWQSRAPK